MNVIFFSTPTLQESLSGIISSSLGVIPNILTSIVVLIIGIIVAKIIRKIIKKFLVSAKVDKLGESLNSIDIIDRANVNVSISTIFSSAIYYFLMLIVLILSSTVLGMPEVTTLISDIVLFVPNLLVALIILILGTLLADAIKGIVLTALKSLGVPSAGMISNALFYFLFINIVLIALKQANIQTDFLEQNISIIIGGVIGAFAIGYGLASKDTMSNMLASLYGKDLFKVGDTITIDGVKGIIRNIDKSKLTLDTGNSLVIVPLAHTTKLKIEFHKS